MVRISELSRVSYDRIASFKSKVAEHASLLFNLPLTGPDAQYIKSSMAEEIRADVSRHSRSRLRNGS